LDAMLDRLRTRWSNTTASVCATTDPVSELGYLPICAVAPSSCTFASPVLDEPGPNNDLLDCLACKIRESMTGAAVRLYADQPVQNTCHQAIGSRGTWYLRRMLRRLKRCQKHGDTISLAECLSEPSTAMRSDLDLASWRSASVDACAATNPITS